MKKQEPMKKEVIIDPGETQKQVLDLFIQLWTRSGLHEIDDATASRLFRQASDAVTESWSCALQIDEDTAMYMMEYRNAKPRP